MSETAKLKSGSGFLPLFSINTLIDIDLGLLNYVFKEFRNDRYFDLNILDYYDLINKVYYRSYSNPLYAIMKNPDSEEDKHFLDECYTELIQTKEAEILENSISTQVIELLKLYKSQSINSSILFYTDKQYEFINSKIQFEGYGLVSVENINKRAVTDFLQFYFKYIEEMYLISNVDFKTVYVSDCGLNLTKDHNDIRDDKIISKLIEQNNQINIIELYRKDIIGKDMYKDE